MGFEVGRDLCVGGGLELAGDRGHLLGVIGHPLELAGHRVVLEAAQPVPPADRRLGVDQRALELPGDQREQPVDGVVLGVDAGGVAPVGSDHRGDGLAVHLEGGAAHLVDRPLWREFGAVEHRPGGETALVFREHLEPDEPPDRLRRDPPLARLR